MKRLKLLNSFLVITLITLFMSACSSAPEKKSSNIKEVQLGTVVSVKRKLIETEPVKPNGGFGVSIGSGGHTGVYGSVDLATIGRILSRPPTKKKFNQEIIIKRVNGDFVAITQPETEPFHMGDKIKIVHRGNQARVIH